MLSFSIFSHHIILFLYSIKFSMLNWTISLSCSSCLKFLYIMSFPKDVQLLIFSIYMCVCVEYLSLWRKYVCVYIWIYIILIGKLSEWQKFVIENEEIYNDFGILLIKYKYINWKNDLIIGNAILPLTYTPQTYLKG